MLSTSQIASPCSVLGLVGTCWSPVHYCFSVNRSVGLTQTVFLWWYLVHDWSGRLMSTGLGRKPLRDSACWVGSLLNRRNYVSIRKSVLLFKCSVWWSAAHNYVRTLQVLQPECLRIASDAPWYAGDMQICEDLGVPHVVDHIRALAESNDSNLAGVLKLLFR